MDRIKIKDVALELGTTAKEIILKSKDLNIIIKSSSSSVDMEQVGLINEYLSTGKIPDSILKANKKEEEEKPNLVKAKKVISKDENENTKATMESIKPDDANKEIIKPKPTDLSTDKDETNTPSSSIENKERTQVAPSLSVKKSKQPIQIIKETKTVKKIIKVNKKTTTKTKIVKKSNITIDYKFASDVDSDNDASNVFMPDFDTRDDILKKFEKANNLINKNRPNNANRPRNPFSKQKRTPERGGSRRRRPKVFTEKIIPSIKIPINIRVHEFAYKINEDDADIVSELLKLGVEVDRNSFLDRDHMELLADTFDAKIEFVTKYADEINYIDKYNNDEIDEQDMQSRPPVITIMGHVDHGKTSLLDVIRKTKITDGEAGGITQHIGAYMVDFKGQSMTFIDTPGHAAFDQMRARGSQITDIIIIVVAADDGVKDQTIESIKHAKKAKVPIIVAITKIDRSESNIDMIKSQMSEQEITPSDWGGDVDFISLSSKTKEGIDTLLETISLQADLLECKSNPKREAKGVVIESSVEVGKGPTASIIMQDGSLKTGDYVVIDTVSGKIRAIVDDENKPVKVAYAGMPVKISGLDSTPPTGSILIAMDNAKEVKNLAQKRTDFKKELETSKTTRVSIEDLTSMINEKKLTSLPVVLKTDFNGSLEAIKMQLESFKNSEVKVNIISSGVGGISEKDLDIASVTDNCVIFGFNVRPTGAIKLKADKSKITISTYSIIYELLDEVKSMLSGLMSPIIKNENTGQAEVRDVFKTPKGIAVAGCVVNDGKVIKGGLARVIRDGVVICDDSRISSLKRFKDDVNEVGKGYDCGIMIEEYNDVKVGDVIETFIQKEERRQL